MLQYLTEEIMLLQTFFALRKEAAALGLRRAAESGVGLCQRERKQRG